jgi:hypothetical protein
MSLAVLNNTVPTTKFDLGKSYYPEEFYFRNEDAVVEVVPAYYSLTSPFEGKVERKGWRVKAVVSGPTSFYKDRLFDDTHFQAAPKAGTKKPPTAGDWQGPEQPVKSSLPSTLYAWVSLNVRADPSTSSKVVKKIAKGTKLSDALAGGSTATQTWAFVKDLGGFVCLLDGDKVYVKAKAPPTDRKDEPVLVKLPKGEIKAPLEEVAEGGGPGAVEAVLAALGLFLLTKS